jgi:hypothetical protein
MDIMGLTRGWLGVLGLGALVAGCVTKASSGGGGGPEFDAAFDASFEMEAGEDAPATDSTTTEAAVDSSTHDTGTTVVDSGTAVDSGTTAVDSSTPVDSGTIADSGMVVDSSVPVDAGNVCQPTSCSTTPDPDSGLPYDSNCSAVCNGFTVSCTCAENLAIACFCGTGRASPSCLNGALSDCGDPATCSADLSSDTSNCGSCGHSCPAGLTCNNGWCAPLQLSFGGSPQAYPDDWVSDGTFIYLASCAERVVTKIPVGGVPAAGNPVVLSSAQTCPRGIAIDGTNAYWTDDSNGTVWTAPMSGTGTATMLGTYGQTWFSGGAALHGIALDANNLYFAVNPSSGNGFVYSMPKTGGTPTVLTNDSLVLRSTVYVDANSVYFLAWDNNGSYLKSVPKTNTSDAGLPSTLLASFLNSDQPVGWLLQGNAFYVGSRNSNTVFTVPKTGGTPTALWSTTLYGSPWLLATDGTSLYWTDFISGYLYEIPLTGGYAQRMATVGGGEPDMILLDSNNIYFSSNFGSYWSMPVSYRP